MRNKLLIVFVLCGLIFSFGSCKDDDANSSPVLTIDPMGTALLKGTLDSTVVKVITNKAWKATVEDGATWCTLSSTENELLVRAEANPDTLYREAIVTISSGSLIEKLTVKQIGVGKSQILVDNKEVELAFDGTAVTVGYVVSEGDQIILPEGLVDEWCSVVLDDEHDGKVIINGIENPSTEPRIAKVVVKAGFGKGEATDTIQVTQLGNIPAAFTYSPAKNIFMKDNGNEIVAGVESNKGEYTFSVLGNSDNHFTVIREENKLKISGKANTTENPIHLRIALETGNELNMCYDTLVITQEPKARAYKLWETYMVDGKPAGIVFSVRDGGMHGLILSLDEYAISDDFSDFSSFEEKGRYTLYKDGITYDYSDSISGWNNLNKALSIDPTLENFPVLKWANAKNVGDNYGWFIPALAELDTLYEAVYNISSCYRTGFQRNLVGYSTWSKEAAQAFIDKLTAIEGATPLAINQLVDKAGKKYYYACYGCSTFAHMYDDETKTSNVGVFGICFSSGFGSGLSTLYTPVQEYDEYYEYIIGDGIENLAANLEFYMSDNIFHRYRAIKRF